MQERVRVATQDISTEVARHGPEKGKRKEERKRQRAEKGEGEDANTQ